MNAELDSLNSALYIVVLCNHQYLVMIYVNYNIIKRIVNNTIVLHKAFLFHNEPCSHNQYGV